jgi:hypothetical protein
MITETFCVVDDFCKAFIKQVETIPKLNPTRLPSHEQPEVLSLSERMTIIIMFHQAGWRNFKTFYNSHVCYYLRQEFPDLVSYERFIALMPRTLLPLMALVQKMRGKSRGISFIDSTTIKVCHIKRERRNKVFAGIAKKSASTMGWFFGFKLHIIVNDIGEIISLHITPGNTDDRAPVPKMTKGLLGKLFGDKGYISKNLSKHLFERGLQLITNVRSNMKNKLLPLTDKLLLRKRFIIETINDQLKNISQIEHTRHRSPTNFLVNLFAGLVAYCLQPKKPSINLDNIRCHLNMV